MVWRNRKSHTVLTDMGEARCVGMSAEVRPPGFLSSRNENPSARDFKKDHLRAEEVACLGKSLPSKHAG